MLLKITIKPIIEEKYVAGTEKTVKLFGFTVHKKTIYNPPKDIPELVFYNSI